MLRRLITRSVCLTAIVLTTGCMSLDYDLSEVPVPVSASPSAAPARDFHVEGKHVLWAHGLFGESDPDVAGMVADVSQGADAIAGFRVTHGAGFHDWLITHLTLTLVRMKTVTVEGQLVGGR